MEQNKFNPNELTSIQKKDAWQLIQKGLQRECRKFLDDAWHYIGQPIESTNSDAVHQRYLGLYDRVRNFDRHIGQYYNEDMSGRHFYYVLSNLFDSGVINSADLVNIDAELRSALESND